MKTILIMAGVVFFIACNTNLTKEEISSNASASESAATTSLPYPLNYSTKFDVGEEKHCKTILEIWKQWDDNDFSNQKRLFADTFEVHPAEGVSGRNGRDSAIAFGKAYRNNYGSVVSSVNGVLSFVIKNNNSGQKENWVSIWGKRIMTDKKGKADSFWLNEAWRLNAHGKVELLYQFFAKITPLQQK